MSQAHKAPGWRRLSLQRRAIARANDEHCAVCMQPFDWGASPNSSAGCTADHLDPVGLGGDLLPPLHELMVRHRGCHGAQGAAISNAMQGVGAGSRGGDPAGYSPRRRTSKPETSSKPKLILVSSSAAASPPPRPAVSVTPSSSLDPYSSPRIETPQPPEVAGTLLDEWRSWLVGEAGITLRPWQEKVLSRALEVDGDGRLVWDEVGVSTPRQSGKSWLIRALALMRCQHAEQFGEPQEVGHLANNLVAARRIQRMSWRWAAQAGLTVRQGVGDERVLWEDGSVWFLSSLKAVYGSSAHVALVDECWDVGEDEVAEGVAPIVVERDESQLWMLSTANELCTPLFLNYRRKAMEGASRVLLMEWSADPSDDLDDPEVWRAASPHWSERRARLVASADPKARRYQHMNLWPGDGDGQSAGWPVGLPSCPRSQGEPPWGSVGAVEVSQDRGRYGAALAARDGSRVAVWTAAFPDLDRAVDWLNGFGPSTAYVGVSLKQEAEATAEFMVRSAGTSETRLATPVLQSLVRRGLLAHDRSAGLMEESAHARVAVVESGEMLSAKRSTGPIPVLKAAAWAVWGAATGLAAEEPAIL